MTDSKPNTDRKNLPIRAEFHKRIKVAASQSGLSMQDYIERNLESALSGGPLPSKSTPTAHAASRFALEQALLHEILERGTPEDAEWIRGNLKNFVEAIRSRAANPPQSRESPRKQKMAR